MLKVLLFAFFNVVLYTYHDVFIRARETNPNFIRDRHKLIMKPELPPSYMDKYKPKFDKAWMDYCDPYHCNDYHAEVCGLNRRKMKFRYFQSVCHLIIHNQCSTFRGFIKYDMIELKHCRVYIMLLRASCPRHCDDEHVEPVCAVSTTRGHTVLFLNQCSLDYANCKNVTLQEYEEADMEFCEHQLRVSPKNI